MTWIAAQLTALLAFLDAHPALYTIVVWPLLTGCVSFFHRSIEPRFPRLVGWLRATGLDLPKAWAALRSSRPAVPELPPSLATATSPGDPRVTAILDGIEALALKSDDPTATRLALMARAVRGKPPLIVELPAPPPSPPSPPEAA